VSAYDGAAGRRKWTCYVGEPTCFIAPCAGGRVLAVAPSGKAFVIDANGNFVGCNDLGAAATAVLRPGDHRAENAIVVGLADGRILTLPRSN
jgi:hypothetical protein